MIRCYDGNVSNGSLKFTLRFPLSSTTNDNELPSGVPTSNDKKDELRKLVFANNNDNKPNFLCGMRQSSSSILIWDLDRGVLSTTINVRNANISKKKKRKSSIMAVVGNEILCDVATVGDQLYALVFLPEEGGGSTVGKCRLYQYDLSAGEDVKVVKKIKLGSVPASDDDGARSNFGIAISKSTIVVRMGSSLRVFDLTSGERMSKVDIPDGLSSNDDEESDSLFAPLGVSPDGRYIVTSTNNQAVVFSEDADGDMQTMALLTSKDDSAITHLDLTVAAEELALVTFQPTTRIASLFTVSTKSSASPLVPQMPQATLQTHENNPSLSLIHAGLHPRKPQESMLLLFQQAKHAGGSAAGSGTSLPMESLSYADDGLEGTVTVGASLSLDDASDKKKRKANNVTLAPGDHGQEASLAMDLTQKKKAKVDQGDEDVEEAKDEDEFPDMEEDGEQGQSIAERLALLSSAMEQTDEEDDEDDEGQEESKADIKKFKLKSATSETLTTLLTQALSSNDSAQLITALQVTDRRLVEGTVRALQALDAERGSKREEANDSAMDATTTGYIPTLMAHIVRRMARRHSLVMPLGVWVKAILAATARSSTNQVLHSHGDNSVEEQMAKEGREMAMKLGPLKNFLNERVECFPQLLRLEGRLALLNQQL